MIDIRLTYAWLVWAKGVDPNLYQPLEILRWTDEQNDVESSPFVSVGAIRLPTKCQRWQNKLFYVPDLKSVFISIYSKVTILISTIAIYRATLILTRMSVHEYISQKIRRGSKNDIFYFTYPPPHPTFHPHIFPAVFLNR